MTGGTLLANTLTVSNGGVADFVGQPLTVALGGTVSVTDSTSQFKVDQGATFSATGLNNNGQVILGADADFIVFNSFINNGAVNLNGGELDIRGSLSNPLGTMIQGTGTISTTVGMSNGGSVQLTGQTSVLGSVNNLASGAIEMSGSASHMFFGNVVNSGNITIDSGCQCQLPRRVSPVHMAHRRRHRVVRPVVYRPAFRSTWRSVAMSCCSTRTSPPCN